MKDLLGFKKSVTDEQQKELNVLYRDLSYAKERVGKFKKQENRNNRNNIEIEDE